jgi:hypothetical protein
MSSFSDEKHDKSDRVRAIDVTLRSSPFGDACSRSACTSLQAEAFGRDALIAACNSIATKRSAATIYVVIHDEDAERDG